MEATREVLATVTGRSSWMCGQRPGSKVPADTGELSSVLPFQSHPTHAVESGPSCPQQVLYHRTTPILAFIFCLSVKADRGFKGNQAIGLFLISCITFLLVSARRLFADIRSQGILDRHCPQTPASLLEWDNNLSLEGTSVKEQRVWVQMHILMDT